MKSVLYYIGFIVAFFGGVFLFFSFEDMRYAFSTPVDINGEAYVEDYHEVKAVKTELYMMMDVCASLETTTTNNSGAITDRDYTYYYVMPVLTEDETYYVAVEVDEDDDKEYDKLSNLTLGFLNGEDNDFGTVTIPFEGGFVNMKDDLKKYYYEWFEENEFFESKSEMEKYALPYVLKPAKLSAVKKMIIGSVIAIVVGIGLVIIGFMPSKKKEEVKPTKTVIEVNGISYPISNFENVNKNVAKGKIDKAVQEIQQITGIGIEEAHNIAVNWNEYWY